jgi:transcriptional regulator with XRE-family HTH domain
MALSITWLDTVVKPGCTQSFVSDYPDKMTKKTPERVGLGMRLKAARESVNLTQQAVADRFGVKKGTVSAWETGEGCPDALVLKALAKLYGSSADGLLFEDSLSPQAMKVAAMYDNLAEDKRRLFSAMTLAFIEDGVSDGDVAQHLPAPPSSSTVITSKTKE